MKQKFHNIWKNFFIIYGIFVSYIMELLTNNNHFPE